MIKKELKYSLHYILCVFAILLPINPKWATFTIVLGIPFWLFSFIKHKTIDLKNIKYNAPILLLYLFYIIGIFYSENLNAALFDLEVKLSFFAFPVLLFLGQNQFKKESFNHIAKAFIIGVFIAMVYGLSKAGLNTYNTGDYSNLFYANLTQTIGFHPTYFGWYINFALVLLSYQFIRTETYKRFGISLLIIIAYSFLWLLSSRNALGSCFLVVIPFIAFIAFKFKRFKGAFFISLIFIGITIIFTILPTPVSKRITKTSNEIVVNEAKKPKRDISNRKIIFDTAVKSFLKSPIIGNGTGDVRATMNETFIEDGNDYYALRNINTHNQLLQTSVALGIIGFIILSFLILYFLYNAWITESWFGVCFILLFILANMTESTLEVQRGVMFFAVGYSVFGQLFWRRLK